MTAMGWILDHIGNTPMVEFTTFDTGPCRLFDKLESQNPGGSGRTLTGLEQFFAGAAPATKMILADPEGSVLVDLVRTGDSIEAGS